MKQLVTTLNKIKAHSPCEDGWKKLLKHLGKTKADDELLPFSVILDSNGLDDALWCCRAAPEYSREWRLFSVWCAQQVLPLMDDERSRNALVVVERFANGQATEEELDAARTAAWNAAGDAARAAAGDARAAARDARDAARDAAWAAWDAAGDAARAAARDARDAARDAAWAAWDAAGDAARAAWDAAGDAAWAAQKEVFSWIVTGQFAEWEQFAPKERE